MKMSCEANKLEGLKRKQISVEEEKDSLKTDNKDTHQTAQNGNQLKEYRDAERGKFKTISILLTTTKVNVMSWKSLSGS